MSRIILILSALAILPVAGFGQTPGITVDKEKKAVIIDAKVAPRKIDDDKIKGVIYPIEVVACYPYPKGQKAHETVVSIDVKPSDVYKALESIGLMPGKPIKGESAESAKGPELSIFLEVPGDAGPRKVPIERTLLDPRSGKPMPKVKWLFTGPKHDEDKSKTPFGADMTGTLIAVFPVTDETIVQTSLTMKEEKFLKLETDKKLLPKEGAAVKLIIEAAK